MHIGDLSNMAGSVSIASAISCIAAIACLANQESARTGNVLGIAGVLFGLASTTADMSVEGASLESFEQVGLYGGIGSVLGTKIDFRLIRVPKESVDRDWNNFSTDYI